MSGQPISISWSVLNNGTATAESWYDSVYLSYDNLFDRDSDMYLGYVQHNGGLDEGASYRVTNTFNVPADLYGTFYVSLVTDSGNRVYERGAEANNTALSSAVSISLPQVADLVVTGVTHPPGRVMVGERNTVTYHVLNQTTASVTG